MAVPVATSSHVPCGTVTPLSAAGWEGAWWRAGADGSADPSESFDSGQVYLDAATGRIVVLDAVTVPWIAPERLRLASATLLGALAPPGSLVEAARRAARLAHDPSLPVRHDNPLFAAAACEVEWASGEVEALVWGDCAVWIRRHQEWSALVSGDMLTDEARSQWESALALAEDLDELYAVRRTVLDDPASWRCPPLGLGGSSLTRVWAADVDAIVVTSDGARLTESSCADLDAWMREGLHTTCDSHGLHAHPHGDIWVVALARDGSFSTSAP